MNESQYKKFILEIALQLQLPTGHFQLQPSAEELEVDIESLTDKDVSFLFEPIKKEIDRLMDENLVKRMINRDAALQKAWAVIEVKK